MNILHRVPSALLLLLVPSDFARSNIVAQVAAHGVSAKRVVFLPKVCVWKGITCNIPPILFFPSCPCSLLSAVISLSLYIISSPVLSSQVKSPPLELPTLSSNSLLLLLLSTPLRRSSHGSNTCTAPLPVTCCWTRSCTGRIQLPR